MDELIRRTVSNCGFDKSGKLCLLKFFAASMQPKIVEEGIRYYSIIPVEQIHAFGSVPLKCELMPTDDIPKEKGLFYIPEQYKPAIFQGVYYSDREEVPFWRFENKADNDFNQFLEDIKKFVPRMEPIIIAKIRRQYRDNFTNLDGIE